MKTRAYNWFNIETLKPEFGIQIFAYGKWVNAAENGSPLLFDSEAEREEKRKELRKIRIQEKP